MEGDPVAVAKALADSARDAKVLVIRGGIMQGRTISSTDVEELAKLPPIEQLRGQVLGAVIAPLTSLLGLVNAPLQNLIGLIDARVEQLQAEGGETPAAPEAKTEQVSDTADAVSDTTEEEPENEDTETETEDGGS